MIRLKRLPALAAVGVLLTGCAQPEIPVQPIPPGPSPAEIADYAAAQAQNRRGQATGNADDVVQTLVSERLSVLMVRSWLCSRGRHLHGDGT
jgi:hypothetical protein